jgi:hypothetical protein
LIHGWSMQRVRHFRRNNKILPRVIFKVADFFIETSVIFCYSPNRFLCMMN